jgi:hypothetical protein
MRLITLLLLLLASATFAQIQFKTPSIDETLKMSNNLDEKVNKLHKSLNFGDSKDLVISLDSTFYSPMNTFYANNPAIFSTLIKPNEFNIFLSSFDFNNRITQLFNNKITIIPNKKSLIKQGITYFIEKKVMLELANTYLVGGKFDLLSFENDFLKYLDVKDLHFLISFVEIFEHWEDYNKYILPDAFATIPDSEIERLKNLVNSYLNKIIANNFMMYRYVNSSNTFAKSFYIDHGNDIFLPIRNRDRDMTGSFKLELSTDLLKMRLFTKSNRSDVLSYQSIFFGGEGYTPYIRYNPENLLSNNITEKYLRDNFSFGTNEQGKYNEAFMNNYLSPVVDMIQKTVDRPFASFQYLGRAKYRIPINGLWRYMGEFKIGFVGKNAGRDVQAIIHKDVNPSIKVLNWDKQIGYPGRLAFEIHIRRDRMLFSQGSTVRLDSGVYSMQHPAKARRWLNLYYFAEGTTGTVQDAAALGLGFANKNFKKQSGHKEVIFDSRLPLRNVYFGVETKLKYQLHNSLLQGLGWFTTFKNEAKSDVNKNNFVLSSNELKRFVWMNDFKLSYRVNKVAINYTASISSQEFSNDEYKNSGEFVGDGSNKFLKSYIINKFSDSKQAHFAQLLLDNSEISKNFNVPKFHFVGTIGVNFFIN